ncbi:hypothetical protein AB0B28_05575 [Glycomyces sp. NPDC046736]|uniref:hypothetical protein n=1 Tax=Glycomyces sp. NPDC046736 TaxID=3155615 RepID=UPI0033E36406
MNEPTLPDFLAGYLRATSRATGKTQSAIAAEMVECYENAQDNLTASDGSAPSAPVATGWKQAIETILGNLPHGRWTTYGELGKAAGQNNAQAVAGFLTRSTIENAYRVLQKGGTVAREFRWPEGVGPRNVADWLRTDGGIRLDDHQRADPAQRLDAAELRKLTGVPQ